jgi:hypothetical protein
MSKGIILIAIVSSIGLISFFGVTEKESSVLPAQPLPTHSGVGEAHSNSNVQNLKATQNKPRHLKENSAQEIQTSESMWVAKHWFKPPARSAPDVYHSQEIATTFSESCKRIPESKKFQNIVTHLQQKVGVEGTKQFPRTVDVQELTQFWKQGNRYFQISLLSSAAAPPVYRVEFYSSSAPDMNTDIKNVSHARLMPGGVLDAEEALSVVQEILGDAKLKGAVEGARTMAVKAIGGRNGPFIDVTYLNSIPIGYRDESIFCKLSPDVKKMTCHCSLG